MCLFLQALEFIHSQGYVHLDVKPENILLSFDDRYKLADFDLIHDFKVSLFLYIELNCHYEETYSCSVFRYRQIILEQEMTNIELPKSMKMHFNPIQKMISSV